MQTLEPVIIVIMLAIIIGIGLLFYARISASQQHQTGVALQYQEDLATLSRLSHMPELSVPAGADCSNCIDIYKAAEFSELLKGERNRTVYYPVFGPTAIMIDYLELSGNKLNHLVLYNNTNTGFAKVTRTYFTMYEPVNRTRQFAMLTIAREQ